MGLQHAPQRGNRGSRYQGRTKRRSHGNCSSLVVEDGSIHVPETNELGDFKGTSAPEELPSTAGNMSQEHHLAQRSEVADIEAPTADALARTQEAPRDYRQYNESTGHFLDSRLDLETLELERVPLAVDIMLKAFNWTILTSLTLLHCHGHEQLWKALRRNFSPKPLDGVSKVSADSSNYHLHMKKIHTNSVSPALISLLKDTLAPNSLEVLFLQDERSYNSTVSIDSIFRGASSEFEEVDDR